MAFMEGWLGLFLQNNYGAQLWFAKLHLNSSNNNKFQNNIIWTDETNVEMVGHHAQHHVWQKPNTIY